MKTLTIFTPTYNRAFCLGNLYNSLLKQTSQDFKWLIIDDGSQDNTKELVSAWIKEKKIIIDYQYQKNQGMHGGHNTAYSIIDTELNVCIDSDDFMPNDAVYKIVSFWAKNQFTENIAGFIGLDSFQNGNVIGSFFPKDIKKTSLEDLHYKHNVKGDKKIVLLTKVVADYPPYPIFQNEKFVPLGTLYLMIDKDYKFLCFNEVLCIVEYMEDGSTRNIIKSYKSNPQGFRYARILYMKKCNYFRIKLKNVVHYISHSLVLKDPMFICKSPMPYWTFVLFPLGFALYIYTLIKTYK